MLWIQYGYIHLENWANQPILQEKRAEMDKKLQFDFIQTQKLIQKIGAIDQFKGEWKGYDNANNRYLKVLQNRATIQSIGSSTRIEGNSLTDAEVETLLKNLKTLKLSSRDEEEVVGYYDTLHIINDLSDEMDLNVSNIHALHNALFKYSQKDERHKGRFKQMSNKVVATYPNGEVRVIFKTTEPYLVEKEIDILLEWTNKSLEEKTLHPLIVVGTFVYEFLSIHPYQDGNGRLSRLLTHLLLLRCGYGFVQYESLEHVVEAQKAAYYQALMDGQRNRYQENEQIHKWLLFFVNGLETLIDQLKIKLAEYQKLRAYLNERQSNIFRFMQAQQPVKVSDVHKQFPEIPLPTLKKDLKYLVNNFVIEKIGKNRGTVYIVVNQQG